MIRKTLVLLVLALLPALLGAAPVKVFVRGGDPTEIAAIFATKGDFEFVAGMAETFQKPTVAKFGKLSLPPSVKWETKEQNVGVGVVLSATGKVLATCIVSSDCAALEAAGERMVRDCKFTPARVGGAPVASYLVFPVSYRYLPVK